MPRLSAERIAQELIKLLETRDPAPALQMMQEDGVLAVILPEGRRLDRLRQMIAIEQEPDPLRRLAALVEIDNAGAVALAERLRFSNAWRDRLQGLASPWPLAPQGDAQAQRGALYRLGVERYHDLALLSAAERAMSRDRLAELLAAARVWTRPVFPLAGRDVTALGIPPGPYVGSLLETVHDWWQAHDFKPSRAECLARLQDLAKP